MKRDLPDSAFAGHPLPVATVPAPVVRTMERLAVLERVRPVLSDAIHAARTEDEARLVTLLGVRIMNAICKDAP